MRRTLIIPAAGTGSRLGATMPKALVPVDGVPMVRRLIQLYGPFADEVVVVASVEAKDAIAAAVAGAATIAIQRKPTGMLDAILAAAADVPLSSGEVWITWCDQVLVRPSTVAALASAMDAQPNAAIVMPTVRRTAPYIHLERDGTGRIVRVLQRRDGDAMPAEGESDMGLFGLSAKAYKALLPQFAGETSTSAFTGERNFLPFIPWVAERSLVVTFPCTDPLEALGVNTPGELAAAEAYLRAREPAE